MSKPIKNKWIFHKNSISRWIKQFLEYSKYQTFDKLLNLSGDEIENLVFHFGESLSHNNTPLTIAQKINAIDLFYPIHDMDVISKRIHEKYFQVVWQFAEF